MDDRLKESISALMDGEANELELQRILSHSKQDDVADIWSRYHGVRNVINNGATDGFQIDVSEAVSRAIELEHAEPSSENVAEYEQAAVTIKNKHFTDEVSSKSVGISKVNGIFALAASVAFAFLFVLQGNFNSVEPSDTTIVYSETEGVVSELRRVASKYTVEQEKK